MADLQRKTVVQRKELQQKESTLQRARHLRTELDRLQVRASIWYFVVFRTIRP